MIATLKCYPNISAKCVSVCVCALVFRNERESEREESMCGIHKSPADTKQTLYRHCISCLYYDAKYQQRRDRKDKEPTPPNRAARGVLLQNAWSSLGEERHHKMNGNVAERIWTHPTRWIEQWSCSILKEPTRLTTKLLTRRKLFCNQVPCSFWMRCVEIQLIIFPNQTVTLSRNISSLSMVAMDTLYMLLIAAIPFPNVARCEVIITTCVAGGA